MSWRSFKLLMLTVLVLCTLVEITHLVVRHVSGNGWSSLLWLTAWIIFATVIFLMAVMAYDAHLSTSGAKHARRQDNAADGDIGVSERTETPAFVLIDGNVSASVERPFDHEVNGL